MGVHNLVMNKSWRKLIKRKSAILSARAKIETWDWETANVVHDKKLSEWRFQVFPGFMSGIKYVQMTKRTKLNSGCGGSFQRWSLKSNNSRDNEIQFSSRQLRRRVRPSASTYVIILRTFYQQSRTPMMIKSEVWLRSIYDCGCWQTYCTNIN